MADLMAAVRAERFVVAEGVMRKAGEYRDQAAICRRLATQMDTEEQRDQLIKMAETWEAMARDREPTNQSAKKQQARVAPGGRFLAGG